MAKARPPSAAVLAARARRAGGGQADVKIEWFTDEVQRSISDSMRKRVKVATEFVKAKVIRNISRPVTIGTGPRGGRVVTDRSKRGEYPRRETSQLARTIFADVRETRSGVIDGFVGTPLEYGLILELKLDRSFLKRTLDEERRNITRITTAPIR